MNTVRTERVNATRELILTTAERLFAEHGVFAVSNRQISEAAGQGNNTAVGYHFGTKTDLVRAIVRKHSEQVERTRLRMLAELGDNPEVRDWVSCIVRPSTEHLAESGSPTWFARFGAQLMTDPGLREVILKESLTSPPLLKILDGLNASLPAVPVEVRLLRADMARVLMVQMLAEHERSLADGTAHSSWQDLATGLIDALVGLWLAPVSK
jgi:AcrR family transcriptional regulator